MELAEIAKILNRKLGTGSRPPGAQNALIIAIYTFDRELTGKRIYWEEIMDRLCSIAREENNDAKELKKRYGVKFEVPAEIIKGNKGYLFNRIAKRPDKALKAITNFAIGWSNDSLRIITDENEVKRIKDISRTTIKRKRSPKEEISAGMVLKTRDEDEESNKLLVNCHELLMIGKNFSFFFSRVRSRFFEQRYRDGKITKIIYTDPHHIELINSLDSYDDGPVALTYAKTLTPTVDLLKKIKDRSKFQINLVPYIPMSYTLFKGGEIKKNAVFVEITPLRKLSDDRPHFLLKDDDQDRRWFEFFVDVCETVYNESKPFEELFPDDDEVARVVKMLKEI